VSAGWIQPIEGFPGAMSDTAQMYPNTLESLSVNGKLYGLPYYCGIYTYGYNEYLLKKAGITSPPENLEDVKNMSLEIQKAGILERPLLHPLAESVSDGDFDFWSLLYASGGRMFDSDLNPVFADSGSAAEQIVGWLADAMNTWKILSTASLATTIDEVYPIIGGAQVAFAPLMDLYIYYAQTLGKRPGTTKISLFPGLQSTSKGTMGWTRAYSIPTGATQLDATWPLLQYVGGKPAAGPHRNQYYAAESWFLKDALGYGYKPLSDNSEMIAFAKAWVDLPLLTAIRNGAEVRENLQTNWYSEWTLYLQAQVQEAVSGTITPRAAMQALKVKTDQLRAEYGD
jgi:multiple sugar transport system substrate-binding protein